jgi:hypothetical protein
LSRRCRRGILEKDSGLTFSDCGQSLAAPNFLENLMGRVNDTIANVNAAVRNLLLTILVGGAGFLGYKGYEIYNEPQKELAERQAELEKTRSSLKQANEDNDRLKVAMNLLKVRHRLARLTVLDQREVPAKNPSDTAPASATGATPPKLMTKIEFAEINEQGEPIGKPKQFDIVGDVVYVDYLHVTFDDKFIEQSDLDRSTSIALFQRIFGEHQEAANGFQLDTVGTRPTAYGRGTQMSEFEKKIWDDFWLIANDPAKAADLGIHAAQKTAVGMQLRPGKTYEIELRASGNMTIRPIETAKAPAGPASEN